jgi:hypothetical protein
MPNKSINIGGEERPVNFGRNFWGEVESLMDESLSSILKNWNDRIGSFRFQSAVTFSALKWGLYDPTKGNEPNVKFTLFQVGDWIEKDPFTIMAKVFEALSDSMPKKESAEASPPQ